MAQVRFFLGAWSVNYRTPIWEVAVSAFRTVPGEQSNDPGHMAHPAPS